MIRYYGQQIYIFVAVGFIYFEQQSFTVSVHIECVIERINY